jgi:putative transposase
VTSLCRRYQVTAGGFYAWLGRAESCHAKQDRLLTKEIVRLFTRHHARYGSPRLHHALQALGWTVSRRRVAQLMRCAGLRAKAVQGYRAKANIHQLYARHPNRLWTSQVTGPGQVWVGDITFLKVGTSWRYLAIVMDQHTRRILAWTLTRRRTALVTSAVLRAAATTRSARGTIFHSDRGSEYMGAVLRDRLTAGDAAERKCQRTWRQRACRIVLPLAEAELTRGVRYPTERALRTALTRYMRYYNTIRLHSGLAYLSPLAFERRAA